MWFEEWNFVYSEVWSFEQQRDERNILHAERAYAIKMRGFVN